MSARNIAVSAIYSDQISAGEALDALQQIGFRPTDGSMLVADNLGSKDLCHEKHTKAPDGAAIGAVVGIVLGACLGLLITSRGSFANVAWIAQFTVLGPLGAMLAGAGAGSMLGLLVGAVAGSAIPEYEALRYEGRTRKGGVLLSVHCDNADWVKRAQDVVRRTGGKSIAARSEAKADFGASEKPLPRTRATPIRTRDEVLEEESVPHSLDIR